MTPEERLAAIRDITDRHFGRGSTGIEYAGRVAYAMQLDSALNGMHQIEKILNAP